MRGRFGLAATMTAVAAVLCAGCAPAGSAGAGHSPPSPAPYPADTGSAPSGGAESLWAVAALGESDAWAVGTHTPLPRGIYRLIEHWNGAKWALVPVPSSGGHVTDLLAVAAISPTAAWAIGKGVAGGHFVTVFMGWNGTRWRYLPSPGTDVSGPAVISARDIWVVGGSKRGTLAEHWDGSKWTIVPTPNAFKDRTRSSGLYAVSGSSSSNVWAVGEYQSGPTSLDTSTLVEHWDGARWQLQPSPNGPPGAQGERYLSAVAAVSRSSALAVGSYGAGLPLTERWDGVRWTTVPNKLQPGVTSAYLTSVAAVDPRHAWAIGEGDQYTKHISFIEKWNGTSWQQLPNPNP